MQSVEGKPCSQAHDAEVYGMFDMVQNTWPGATPIENAAVDGYLTLFYPFVWLALPAGRRETTL